MATMTAEKIELRISVEGDTAIISWSEEATGSQFDKLVEVLNTASGVLDWEWRNYYTSVRIRVLSDFFDVNDVVKALQRSITNVLEDVKVPDVKVKLVIGDGRYAVLETNYCHSDRDLVVALEKLGIYEVYFDQGGYNINFRLERVPIEGLELRFKEAINAFYAGQLPFQELDYRRVDDKSDGYFTWRLNRRLDYDQRRQLIKLLEKKLPGLTEVYFTSNDYELTGRPANSFFKKNRMATQVVDIVERFIAKLDKKAARS